MSSVSCFPQIFVAKAQIDGDVFFPEDELHKFEEVRSTSYPADERNEFGFTYRVLERVMDGVPKRV